MTSGGARNRGGRPPEDGSVRSEDGRYALDSLPRDGYRGDPPEFPLPDQTPREAEVWAEAWRSPQAWAWAQPGQEWRHRTVALWVRLSVRCEDADASASLLGQLHRFADQIGMTTAGLREMGWKVEAAAKPGRSSSTPPAAPPPGVTEMGAARKRLRS